MNCNELKAEDWNFILESLKYSKIKFENYGSYPSQEFKLSRIAYAVKVIEKVNSIKDDLKA
jgi:hypothetical protein